MVMIHNIGGTMLNNSLLETPVDVIAIDTGYPGSFGRFRRRFERRRPLTAPKKRGERA